MNLNIANIPVMAPNVKLVPVPATVVTGGQSNVVIASVNVPPGAGLVEAIVSAYDPTSKDVAVYRASIAAKNQPQRAAAATGTLTSAGTISDGDTVTIDGKVYTFKTTLTNTNGYVLIGADRTASHANLKAAINLAAGAGTTYAAATTLHPTVTATSSDGTTTVVTAKSVGTTANSIGTTETGAQLSWGGATLSGGLDAVIAVGSVSAVFTAEDDSAWTATLAVNGPNGTVELKATADGTNNTTFNGMLSVYSLG